MVDEITSDRTATNPSHTRQDLDVADRLRESPPKVSQPAPLAGQDTAQTSTASAATAADKNDLASALTDMQNLQGGNNLVADTAAQALQQKAADSSMSGLDDQMASNSIVRHAVGMVEGVGYAAPGAVQAMLHDFGHPGDLAEKALTAATIGIGMRVLLPQSGAAKAVVGAVMGYYMIKDAATPLLHGWKELGKARTSDQVDQAAKRMGDGLGAFAWDAAVGSVAGLQSEKFAGRAMDATLGTARYAAFEKFKVDVDQKLVSKPIETVLSPVSRLANWASEKMMRKEEAPPKIEFQAVKHKFAEVEAQHVAQVGRVDLHLKGVMGSDGHRLGFSETLDLLVNGLDPRNLTKADVHEILGQNPLAYPGNRVDLSSQTISDALSKEGITAASLKLSGQGDKLPGVDRHHIMGPTEPPGEFTNRDGSKSPNDAAKPQTGPSDLTDKPVGITGTAKPYVTKAETEVNAVNYGKLAVLNKTLMDAWTDKRVLIEDAKERLAGPVHAAISPEYKPMDKGYILVRNQMMQIGGQIADEADLQYVIPLFSRLAMASTQHISDGLTSIASLKYQLDLKALETHSELVRNMKKAGIDPDVVLSAKTPAIFSISHDGGAGPHTMRQINGVWNVDHVLFPRNMIDSRSITTSGIYGHELGHDQYGGILKFDESIREQVITDAVAKGLGARAKDKIHMPGVGDVTKQQLIEAIFKAQADENTADIWGAAWTGHNAGGALGLLLQSLRKGGQLETRNVFGTEFKADDNPYGFEPHAFDAIRPKIVAAVMRLRANGDTKVLDYASALERYAEEASKPGDYVFANMDKPGETVTIPRKDMEDVIPHLIDAQLNTKLSALQGHSFAEILPDLPSNLAKMDTLSDLMVDAIKNNKKPSQIPFSVSQYSIIQVFGAGLPAASRLVAEGMDAKEANAAVNTMSDYLRGLYHGNDPHVDPLKPTALQTIRLTSPKTFISSGAQMGRDFVHKSGVIIGRTDRLGDWFDRLATPMAASEGAVLVDKKYEKAVESQTLGLTDLPPTRATLNFEPPKSAANNMPRAGSWLASRDNTMQDLAALDQTRKDVLKGAQNQ